MRQLPHPDADEVTLAGVLSALGDPVRLGIISRLAEVGEASCGEIDVPVAKSTLSHHLKVLREAGIIVQRSVGTRCFLSLRPELEQAFPGLLGSVLRHAPVSGLSAPCAARHPAIRD